MRMAELSRRSGVPTPTIKYYLREGLLPPGDAPTRNQATYDDAHLERLELVRALRDVAGLPIATIQRVVAAMDGHSDGESPVYLSTAMSALSDPLDVPAGEGAVYAAADREATDLLDAVGWDVDPDSPGRDDLVRALVAVHRHLPGRVAGTSDLLPYARAARQLADHEVPDDYDPDTDVADVLRFSVLGTLLFEQVLLALRRLAHTDRVRAVARRHAATGGGGVVGAAAGSRVQPEPGSPRERTEVRSEGPPG